MWRFQRASPLVGHKDRTDQFAADPFRNWFLKTNGAVVRRGPSIPMALDSLLQARNRSAQS